MTEKNSSPMLQPKSSSLGFWVLAFSILLNCFLVGLIAAPLLSPHPNHISPSPGRFLDHVADALSPADAKIFNSIYGPQKDILASGHKNIEEAMHKLTITLAQPTVDQDELQHNLDDVAAAHQKIQQAMSSLIKAAATELSPEGRRIFAREGLHPPGGHSGDHPPNHVPDQLPPHEDHAPAMDHP